MPARAGAPSGTRSVTYRGTVLDLLVVALNLVAGPRATDWVTDLISYAPDERTQGLIVGIGTGAMLLLPALAAVLKRRRTQARLAALAEQEGVERIQLRTGCLFNPIFYLSVNLILGCAVVAGIGPLVFGSDLMDRGEVFVPLILGVIVASVWQTVIVYRYFEPLPAKARPSRFLESRAAEFLGDACIYVNTMLFQVVWLTVATTQFEPVTSVQDAFGRLFYIFFAALLAYFPPRMLYLVEELRRPRGYLTLLLANAAMLYRLFVGGG
ncbi:MAG: hypothetical protein M9914_00685 [Trueperaceae bacterium]|nr:hypothetical protein [Trueperaceae bacterium]MCO5172685.1 hypothetical protein [Trueperaceae bacterium]MCW5820812.1 hypothetical protein [Trueperaceae bacterium]